MSRHRLSDFSNRHRGETIYVFGSGATLNYLDPTFFDDKRCVATNFVGGVFGLKHYDTFTHYHQDAAIVAQEKGARFVIAPRREHGVEGEWVDNVPPNVILFDTDTGKPGLTFDPDGKDWPTKPESLVIGSSSLHGSMHLAAHMGAKSIVLVAADCGTLGFKHRVDGYETVGHQPWALYEEHLRMMKSKLQAVYGCQIYSLNPFANPNLEGVPYRSPSNAIN